MPECGWNEATTNNLNIKEHSGTVTVTSHGQCYAISVSEHAFTAYEPRVLL